MFKFLLLAYNYISVGATIPTTDSPLLSTAADFHIGQRARFATHLAIDTNIGFTANPLTTQTYAARSSLLLYASHLYLGAGLGCGFTHEHKWKATAQLPLSLGYEWSEQFFQLQYISRSGVISYGSSF